MTTERAVVELEGASKRYGAVEALRGVDLRIDTGEGCAGPPPVAPACSASTRVTGAPGVAPA
jgi:hypothetical protein